MARQGEPWTFQWHIAADGTVIGQLSKGDEPHRQLFGSYTTNPEMSAFAATMPEMSVRSGRLAP